MQLRVQLFRVSKTIQHLDERPHNEPNLATRARSRCIGSRRTFASC
jgi:hypothetical protein